ncbi:23S rRNA (adenine(2503)-C(2))-methyltransferase RlmN [Acidipropionibacterium virtanenii]|uniref:Probable dual-specificity RNA methyltransferase RlmN n=1 Tax=Acidipropionibacterium virtanenii TaxID=2057246 RepID=A0A344UT67_9ACTN|nr:23S rRNA (adenine(2503)-C(2))-methyltransferase RlmN [Acidipropionibacterium virtanenii]AXE38465.1 putative dual-specificity RNA methyltransferase RlmN [Acidipropionibacterium virtanenii]
MSTDPRPATSPSGLVLPITPLAEPGTEMPVVVRSTSRARPPRHWIDLSVEERVDAVKELGLPGFRAKQISEHVFAHHDLDPQEWTDLPKAARGPIADAWFPELLTEVSRQSCDNGTTVKTLWRLHGGSLVESVLMHYPATRHNSARTTLCISSQAGCGMACPFCATGQGGIQRNMSTAEIVAQVLAADRLLASGAVPGAGRVSNIVFMGMGEPMANYRSVLAAVRSFIAPAPHGIGMSARGITISTVGLIPRIKALTEEGIPATLAVSLHAPDDELRDELIPANKRWKVDALLDAAWEYARTTGRRVSIEYALMRDINDQADRAAVLARQIRRRGDWTWAHVNLIPLNPTPGSRWTASRPEDQDAFVKTLERWKIPVTVRDTRGKEIDGACGQLAARGRAEGAGV